jgi:sentrin-specific protease 1
VFLSFLYSMLSQRGFAAVKSWTSRGLGQADLFARSALFFPINVSNAHWCLAVADMKRRTLTYYDSLGSSGTRCLQTLLQYLRDEHQDKKGSALLEEWELISPEKSSPQQANAVDCGVFTLSMLNVLHHGFELNVSEVARLANSFSQADMPRIREQIQLDLGRGRVWPHM